MHTSRLKLSKYVALVSGHNRLAYHASLCDDDLEPGCSFCNTSDKAFFRLLTACPALISRIAEIMGQYELGVGFEWRVDQVREFANIRQIKDLMCNYYEDLEHSGDRISDSGSKVSSSDQ